MAPPRLLAVAAAMAAVTAIPTTSAGATPAWKHCAGTKLVRCGVLKVPLDPSGAQPGTVRLAGAVIPTDSKTPATTAVVALAGGPGQAALPLAFDFALDLSSALKTRDLLIFDQRGTGDSGSLSCRALLSSRGSLATATRRCAEQLGAKRAFYTTAQSVADIEAMRVAGGYSKLSLYGVSYGTKVALAYAAAHPANVESLVLDSVVTPEGPDALQRSSLAAVPRVIGQDLCADGDCRRIANSPVRDITRLAAKLATKPLSGAVYSPNGHRYTAHLSTAGLFGILMAGDLNPTLRAEFPGAVRAALTGDAKPILRLSARSAGLENAAHYQSSAADSDALFLATTCEENTTFPWTRGAPQPQRAAELKSALGALPAGSTGIFPAKVEDQGLSQYCLGWPVASPQPAAQPSLPNVPTLILDGRSDLRTPIEDAQDIAGRIPSSQLVLVPHSGHSVLGSEPGTCASHAVDNFYAGKAIVQCRKIADPFYPTPRPPLSIRRVHGVAGYPRAVGRTLTALLATITDGNRQLIGEALAEGIDPSGVGGLRGGYIHVARKGLEFHHYEYIPGVIVTGMLSATGTSHLRLSGRSAAKGRVTITRGGLLRGTLGGHHVRKRLTSASAAATGRAPLPTLAEAVRRGRLIHAGA